MKAWKQAARNPGPFHSAPVASRCWKHPTLWADAAGEFVSDLEPDLLNNSTNLTSPVKL